MSRFAATRVSRRLRARLPASAVAVALIAGACTHGSSTPRSPSASAPGGSEAVYRLQVANAGFTLAAPVQREVAVARGGIVYLAGGLDASGRSVNGVFSLNPVTGHLRQLGSVPHPFHDAAAAVFGNTLFIFGGGAATVSSTVQSFDLVTHHGAIAGHLPVPLADLQAARLGDRVYLVGGYDGRTPQSAVYTTSDGVHFRTAARLPVGLRYPAVVASRSELVVAGGQSASGTVGTLLSVNPSTGRTTTLRALPEPVSQAVAFSLGGRVYVAGGLVSSGRATRRVTQVDAGGGASRTVESLPSGVADAAVASDGSTAWLLGGWRGSTVAQVAVATLKPATPANGTPASPSASPPPPRAGSAAAVRPFGGLLLIADRGNNRLLVVNARKRIVWKYPSRSLPRPPVRFYFPDDAFWVHHGHAILVNEEENHVLAEIAYPSGRTLWTYGHAGVPGSSSGYLHQPDDVYPYPGGGVVVADALNCRILFFDAKGRPSRQIGRTGDCTPNLPSTVGYPNGDTPLPSGQILITQLNGGYVDRIEANGRIRWGLRVPGAPVPSDPQRLADGSYLVADYQLPGRIVRFAKSGRVLWTYGPSGGRGMLDHPSIAVPLPNGLVAAADDYQDRVVIIDPATNGIVWQYGVRGRPGSTSGLLHVPDGLDLLFADGTVPLHIDFPNATTRSGRP